VKPIRGRNRTQEGWHIKMNTRGKNQTQKKKTTRKRERERDVFRGWAKGNRLFIPRGVGGA